MELLTLQSTDDLAVAGPSGDKVVVLRASEFPADAPAGAKLIVFAGSPADADARLDAGYLAANQAADFFGEMFYKAQY